jgi:predicted DNA-binding transcriptional regulator YafY
MDTISNAITKRCMLAFWYDGTQRIVEPHTYGVLSTGEVALNAWQLNKAGDTGTVGWRLYHLDRMSAVTALGERFVGTRPDYERGGGKLFVRVLNTL